MDIDKRATFAIQFTSSATPCERRDPCGLYTVSIIDRDADGMRPAVRVTIGGMSIDIHDHTCLEDFILFERVISKRGDGLSKIVRAATSLVDDHVARERHATETFGLTDVRKQAIGERLEYVATLLDVCGRAIG